MYFVKRILFLVPLLLLISFLAFVLVRVAPGGPFDKERKPASPEIERNLQAKYHLNESLWKQYLRFLGVGFERDAGMTAELDHGSRRISLSPPAASMAEVAKKKRTLEKGDQTADDFLYARKLMDRHGALSDTVERANHYGDIARDALAIFPDSEWKAALLEAVDFCVARVS